MQDIICVNDSFSSEYLKYFQENNIITPVKDKIYSIREVVKYLVGESGILLNEIVNPPVEKISPTTGMKGKAEQSWAISRFRDLQGNAITKERIKELIKL